MIPFVACTSGRHIPGINDKDKAKPCGRQLVLARDPKTGREVRLCAVCDGDAAELTMRKRSG